jgi:hypothetical protein
MSNDLAILSQLEKNIHQLSPHLRAEVENYIEFLLRKYQTTPLKKTVTELAPYHIKPVSLGLKIDNVDNIADILENYE